VNVTYYWRADGPQARGPARIFCPSLSAGAGEWARRHGSRKIKSLGRPGGEGVPGRPQSAFRPREIRAPVLFLGRPSWEVRLTAHYPYPVPFEKVFRSRKKTIPGAEVAFRRRPEAWATTSGLAARRPSWKNPPKKRAGVLGSAGRRTNCCKCHRRARNGRRQKSYDKLPLRILRPVRTGVFFGINERAVPKRNETASCGCRPG